MSNETFSILVELAAGKAPPTEIRLLRAGVNETTKGPIVCNAKAARATIAAVVAHYGRPVLNFDYGHGQVGFVGSYETARSAGWFELQERAGALWATNIEWTPRAKQALSEREFRYFSPALMRDPDSGEIKSLINVALTNTPATKGQLPLVASAVELDTSAAQTLSAAELEICRLLSVAPAEYAAERAQGRDYRGPQIFGELRTESFTPGATS